MRWYGHAGMMSIWAERRTQETGKIEEDVFGCGEGSGRSEARLAV